MYSIELSEDAIDYYDNLKSYLTNTFDNKTKDKAMKVELEKLENLKSFPFIGMPAERISDLLKGYYVLIDKHSYIFYRVLENRETISVELILSTQEDITKRIQTFILEK